MSLSDCVNEHAPTDHPCNFPDAQTENDLRSPFSFKILDAVTFVNIVGTTETFPIHPNDVKLYDSKWKEIDPKPRLRFDGEWIFDNFTPYIDVPFNNPQALLDLENRKFYLQVSPEDVDTIVVHFNSCLVKEVMFNDLSTERPPIVPTSASFYFLKE